MKKILKKSKKGLAKILNWGYDGIVFFPSFLRIQKRQSLSIFFAIAIVYSVRRLVIMGILKHKLIIGKLRIVTS